METISDFEELLELLVERGGSDLHLPPFDTETDNLALGKPCTWIYAPELSVPGLLAGIEAGHVFVSEDIAGPRLFLNADADGDRRYEARMGDEVRVPAGTDVRLRCRVEGAAGCQLRVRSTAGDGAVAVEGDDFTYNWTARAESDTFFRAEVVDESDPSHPTTRALSNPIYLAVEWNVSVHGATMRSRSSS